MNLLAQTIDSFNPTILIIPGIALFVVIALMVAIKVAASRYVKVAPDEIAVFSGRKYRYKDRDGKIQERGFYLLQGGGKILVPIVEKVEIIKIGAFQVEVEEENVPNKDNVGVNIKGVATCRLSIAESDMANMITNFLNKTPKERVEFIQNILKGHVRSIVGNLTIDQLLRNRQGMNEQVVSESTPELKRLGIDVINLVIQDVRDNLGYIESLGKQKVAEALRDSKIATATAEKETAITVSTAQREAAEVSAQNETKVAEAQKARDVQIATFKQETETKRAVAETAFAIAKTEQEQTLRVQEAKRDKAAAEAGAEVQEAEAVRRTMELKATTITSAEADAKSLVIKAEASKTVAALAAETVRVAAEGEKNATIQKAQGEAQSRQVTAEAEANAIRLTRTAEAEGNKAAALAVAAGQEATLLAQASGVRASKLAEAEGALKMSEAMAKLSPQAQLILIMDRLPALLDKGGDAGAKVMGAMFTPIGEAVARIDNIQITDLGGGQTTREGLAAIGGLVPQIALDFFAKSKAMGIDVTGLLKYLKMDPSELVKIISPEQVAPPAAPETTAEPEKAPAQVTPQ